VMAQDLLTTYKLGWKTSYYQKTHDLKSDDLESKKEELESIISLIEDTEEDDCESCKI